MNNANIGSTLINKDGALCLIWATIQQLVVAISTYALIEAIRLTTQESTNQSIPYIVGFVVCLILVYVPNTVSLVYLQKWRLASFETFVHRFIDRNQGRTTWTHSRDKTKHESWLTNESSEIYTQATDVIYQVFSTLLSSVLNVLVIALAIKTQILLWYVLAAVILFVSNRIFQKLIARASLEMQTSRKNLSNCMLSAWENIFVGNSYNLKNWSQQFLGQVQGAKKSAVKYDITRSLISSATVSVALMLIAAGNGLYFLENQGSVPAIAALFITLPRQLQIIQNIFAFFNLYLSWEGVRHQMTELYKVVNISEKTKDLTQFINIGHLSLHHSGMNQILPSIDAFFEKVEKAPSGRFTLRGKNGSGKSTLLSIFAEQTADKSFFLPSQFVELNFLSQQVVNASDGNRILSVFEEVAQLKDVKYIVLDEWDANLDADNILAVDKIIDQLSTQKVVLESRHRV